MCRPLHRAAITLLAAGCSSDPTAPLPREGAPDVFEVRVSGGGRAVQRIAVGLV